MDSDDSDLELEVWNLAKSYSSYGDKTAPLSGSSGQKHNLEDTSLSDSDIESEISEKGATCSVGGERSSTPSQKETLTAPSLGVGEIDEACVEMETENPGGEKQIDETGVEIEAMNLKVEHSVSNVDCMVDENLGTDLKRVRLSFSDETNVQIQAANTGVKETNETDSEMQLTKPAVEQPDVEIQDGPPELVDFSSRREYSIPVKADTRLQAYSNLENAGTPIIHVPTQLLTGTALEWRCENEEWVEAFPGVKMAYQTINGVNYGYMEIEPRTLKPFEIEQISTLIYWVQDGQIVLKTNALELISNNPVDFALRKFHYEKGNIIVIPPKVPSSFENYTDEIVRLGFVQIQIGPAGVQGLQLPVTEAFSHY